MNFSRHILLPLTGLFLSAAAYSQTYSPTVVVTNRYRAETLDTQKSAVEMAVPDSVKRFDMTFDYSVFDRPYRGAYEFSPYSVEMRPVAGGHRVGKFYLNAGIGYTLHPELDLLWSPLNSGRVSLDVYAGHSSFAGDYRDVGLDGGRLTALRDESGRRRYRTGWNYDMDNAAGAALRYDWSRTCLSADIAYIGLQQRDWLGRRSFDRGRTEVRVFSKDTVGKGVTFDAALTYGLGRDRMNRNYVSDPYALGENLFGASLKMEMPVRRGAGRFAFDFTADAASYMEDLGHTAALFQFAPRYVLTRKSWTFSLGVRLAVPVSSINADGENGGRSQYAYPDIKIKYDFRKIPLCFWVSAGGGEKLNSYSSVVGDYRHYGIASALLPRTHNVLRNSVENCSLALGLRGRIHSVFGYEIFASGSCLSGSVVESVKLAELDLGSGGEILPVYDIGYSDSLHGRLRAGVNVHYSDDWGRIGLDCRYDRLFLDTDGEYVLPAAFTGDFSVQFNIIGRISALLGCEFSSVREGRMKDISGNRIDYRIPAWADPYLSIEYRYSRRMTFWLRGSGFTGQAIQRTPLYAERGPEITAGLRLNFGK